MALAKVPPLAIFADVRSVNLLVRVDSEVEIIPWGSSAQEVISLLRPWRRMNSWKRLATEVLSLRETRQSGA